MISQRPMPFCGCWYSVDVTAWGLEAALNMLLDGLYVRVAG